jgi:hypothetical protein
MALLGGCRVVSIPEAAIPVQLQSVALPPVTAGSDAWVDARPDAMVVALPEAHLGADAGKSVDLVPDAPEPVGPASSDAGAHPYSQPAAPSVGEVVPCIRAADRFAERSFAEAAPEAAEEQQVASPPEPADWLLERLPPPASLPLAGGELAAQLVASQPPQAEQFPQLLVLAGLERCELAGDLLQEQPTAVLAEACSGRVAELPGLSARPVRWPLASPQPAKALLWAALGPGERRVPFAACELRLTHRLALKSVTDQF